MYYSTYMSFIWHLYLFLRLSLHNLSSAWPQHVSCLWRSLTRWAAHSVAPRSLRRFIFHPVFARIYTLPSCCRSPSPALTFTLLLSFLSVGYETLDRFHCSPVADMSWSITIDRWMYIENRPVSDTLKWATVTLLWAGVCWQRRQMRTGRVHFHPFIFFFVNMKNKPTASWTQKLYSVFYVLSCIHVWIHENDLNNKHKFFVPSFAGSSETTLLIDFLLAASSALSRLLTTLVSLRFENTIFLMRLQLFSMQRVSLAETRRDCKLCPSHIFTPVLRNYFSQRRRF